MEEYNSLLQRQIRKCKLYLSENSDNEITKLLDLINETYFDFEEEKLLLERSIEISSREYHENIIALRKLQTQLIHNEKMAGIGQLSAGIAHEINNPLGFVQSNIETLSKYTKKMQEMYTLNKNIIEKSEGYAFEGFKEECNNLKEFIKLKKIDHIFDDLSEIIIETSNGLSRIEKIVKSLLGFARKGVDGELTEYDLNKGIKDTITIANNEIKYYATVVEEFGDIPTISVYSGEINQVILNLIVNAAHAIKIKGESGAITIRTYSDQEYIFCEITDDGIGIPQSIIERIFEPFFTTKPVGTGTGLGLSIAHDIIVNKHRGQIFVSSKVGEGTTFKIKLPILQKLCNK